MQKARYTKWVKSYAKQYWYYLALLFLLALGAVLFELISPLPLKFMADNVFGSQPPPHIFHTIDKSKLLLIAAGGYIVIYGTQVIYNVIQALINRKFSQAIDKATLKEASAAVSAIPYNNIDNKDAGTYLYQITNQSQQMSEYLLGNVISIVQSILVLVGIVAVLAAINLRIMLITFCIMPLLALCVIYFGNLLEKRANDTELSHARVYSFVNETLTKLRTIQAFALERKRQAQLDGLVNTRNKFAMKQLFSNEMFDLSTQIIIFIGISVAIILGGHSVFAGAMTFGDLLIFISYTSDVFDEVSSVVNTIGGMKEQAAALQQAYDTINSARSAQLTSGTLKQAIQGKIEFKDVTVSYNNKAVLENINMMIPPNAIVAIVGLSGSGKTTIINSLLRFTTPDKGWVSIDDHDIREFDISFLREHIALIDQDPVLFKQSVSDNISVADSERPNNLPDVMTAAVIANSNEFIDSMSDKYDSPVDDDKLSGGQKQRLAIARAYYKKAPIVLMDEPTSALDRRSAEIFANNIFSYFKNRTVIIITHDLSLLTHIPNIFVVDNHSIEPISKYGGLAAYTDKLHIKDS